MSKAAPENSLDWKCDWMDCTGGSGLAGNGRCPFNGEWDNPKCPQFNRVPQHMRDKPMTSLMICPKAFECEEADERGHCIPHEKPPVILGCLACIPVEPEHCPDCGHKAHKGYICLTKNINGCYCECADLQPEERVHPDDYDKGFIAGVKAAKGMSKQPDSRKVVEKHCTVIDLAEPRCPPSVVEGCDGCPYWQEKQPTPTMPLIEQIANTMYGVPYAEVSDLGQYVIREVIFQVRKAFDDYKGMVVCTCDSPDVCDNKILVSANDETMTFREEIAAILNDTDMLEDCKYGEHNSCPKGDYQTACRRCALDRILLAVGKLAEGMPKTQCVCQAYIRKELQ